MYNFKKDLALGSVAEKELKNIFNNCGILTNSVDSSNENRMYWDLESKNLPWSVDKEEFFRTEVKFDIYEHRSGNVAIETYNTKIMKPSGINSTKADFWCQCLTTSKWIALVSELKQYIEDNKPFRIINNGGDSNACLYLYKSDILLPEVFYRIDNLTNIQLLEKMRELWLCSKYKLSSRSLV